MEEKNFRKQSGVRKMRETIDYVKLENTLNHLQLDSRVRSYRNAPVKFVQRKLLVLVEKKLQEAGLTRQLEQGFLEKDPELTKAFYGWLQANAETLNISQDAIRRIKRTAKSDDAMAREAAQDELRDYLLSKEYILFYQRAKIVAKVWSCFINSTEPTGEITKQKIIDTLGLSPEEAEAFSKCVISHVIYVTKELREKVETLREKTGMFLTDFQNYACVGKEAWEAFYISKKNPEKLRRTSQDTLLKLVIGFGLDEDGAWEFMDTAQSAFIFRKDLVFLACVCCNHMDPVDVQQILDFFNADKEGTPCYHNPYY